MAVENATYIHELNAAAPTQTEDMGEGDDHIRLLKATIKATFPQVQGTTSVSHTVLDDLQAGEFVRRDGSAQMTGHLVLSGAAPTNDAHAVFKSWVESQIEALIPQGTRMVFVQASAPTGWTKVTTINDRVLRLVNTSGGGLAGDTWAISGLTHSHTHSVPVGQHYHETPVGSGGSDPSVVRDSSWHHGTVTSRTCIRSGGTGTVSESTFRSGPVRDDSNSTSGGPNTSVVSSSGAWRPPYADAIVCEKA